MVIGPYTILEQIGAGGMGVIYKAEHSTLEQVVAIKALTVNISGNPELRERFVREARIQAKLSHPNVVNILNFLDIDGNYYIVMEYVEGETLESMIRTKGLLPPDACISMFKQILAGAGYAHSMGIVHRDIKPSNIIIKKDGTVKLTDFGIAKISGDLQHTRTGVKVGTLWYMSPEQVRGQPASVSSDIYSLGVTLFEMLTGQVPFSGNSEYSIMKNIVECSPPSPRQIYPYVPIPLENIIMTAMAKEPAQRFRSVEEFVAALEKPSHFAPRPTTGSRFPWPRNRNGLVASAMAITVAALLVLLLQSKETVQSASPPPPAPVQASQPEVPPPPAVIPRQPAADATGFGSKVADNHGEQQVEAPVPPPVTGRESTQDDEREHAQVREYLEKAARLHRSGDYGQAIERYQRVLALAPGNQEAKRGLRDARSARETERQLGTLK